jgi:transposase InsO family protein
MTLSSNVRWCSDQFDIRCWNGEVVRVVFSLDTHDREVLRWKATTAGVTGEMVRDLIAESVEYRFGNVDRLPRPLQWLSDNGPAYTAKETAVFARLLGFKVCTTPAYSPESNGMAKTFVKTFKRDYI